MILPLLISYGMMMPSVIGRTLEYSPGLYISLMSVLVLLLLYRKGNGENKAYLVFLFSGILTTYWDVFVYPMAALGFPLVVVLYLSEEKKVSGSLIRLIRLVFFWGLGYSVMWVLKWTIGSILTGSNLFADGLETIAFRTSSEADGIVYTAFQTISLNLQYFFRTPVSFLFLAFLMTEAALLMTRMPKNAEALTALGYTYFGVKRYDAAISYADQAIAVNKNYGDAYVLKGDVAAMQDNGGEAANNYQMAMNMDPKNPNGYLGYANIYRKVDPAGAEDAINRLRQANPEYPVDAELGHLMFNADNMEKAYAYYSKTQLDKLAEGRLAEYALVAGSVDKKDEALKIAKFGVQKFPESNAFLRLGIVNSVALNLHDEALGFAERLMKKEGETNSGDLIYYGQALAGKERYDEAIAKFQKAIEVDKTNIMPYQHISETYAKMGHEDKAIEFSRKYMELNPNVKPHLRCRARRESS